MRSVPVSLLSALLTLSSCSSYGVVGYIHSKTPLCSEDFPSTARTRTEQLQVRTVPELSNHDRIHHGSSLSSSSSSASASASSPFSPSQSQDYHSRTQLVAFAANLPSFRILSQSPSTLVMTPLEAWCLSRLDRWYARSQSLKCPFLRRRLGDFLDNVESIMKHTVIRKELMGTPQAWRPAGHNKKLRDIKYKNRSLQELKDIIYDDWKPDTGKGYYVTGKLTTAIYRDDCLFLGPDPDMPIRGLRKYVGVAAHLFDFNESESTLKSLEIVDSSDDAGHPTTIIEAEWQLKGILKLPWRPHLPTFCGKTRYYFDKEGLIERHEELWDMTVSHAFCQTLFPKLAAKIWKDKKEPAVTTV